MICGKVCVIIFSCFGFLVVEDVEEGDLWFFFVGILYFL